MLGVFSLSTFHCVEEEEEQKLTEMPESFHLLRK